MNFVTFTFASFFLTVLAVLLFCRRGSLFYKIFLLTFNIYFYAYAGTAFLPLLFFVAFMNWLCARLNYSLSLRRRKTRKTIMGVNIAIHVFLLAFYKYYEFFLVNLEMLFTHFGLVSPFYELISTSNLLFPIGLSFYIFQGLSYSIDSYRSKGLVPKTDSVKDRGRGEKPQSFLNVLLFVSFFPTILAGPLLRGKDFFPTLNGYTQKQNTLSKDVQSHLVSKDIIIAFTFILSGLFKKVVLASYLSEHIVRDVFMTPEYYAPVTILIAVYAYAMQIYCDFSGYSDLAMGIAKLMCYDVPQNFKAPYLATSLQDFWRRWHISLSTWLRDYLYIPLGGSKRGIRSFNLTLTMTLGGLWHGSHLHFLIWGFMHGIGLSFVHAWKSVFEKLFPKIVEKKKKEAILEINTDIREDEKSPKASEEPEKQEISPSFSIYTIFEKIRDVFHFFIRCFTTFLAWFLTFHFVCLLWIFFRATDTKSAFFMIERMSLFFTNTSLTALSQAMRFMEFHVAGDFLQAHAQNFAQTDFVGAGFSALVLVVIFVSFSMQFVGPYIFRFYVWTLQKLWASFQILIIAIFTALILKMGPDGVMPFIYFQF